MSNRFRLSGNEGRAQLTIRLHCLLAGSSYHHPSLRKCLDRLFNLYTLHRSWPRGTSSFACRQGSYMAIGGF